MGAIDGIEHVVVLMLENRSFDCMFGRLRPKSPDFEGLAGTEANPFHKPDGSVEQIPVWNDEGMDAVTATIPDPDPGELFAQDMTVQLFGLGGTPGDLPPPMTGFVDNYMRQALQAGEPQPDKMAVMHHFTRQQVPVITALADAFGVSDQWHASAPCQTWPNRFFVHTATAGGYVNNSPPKFPYLMPSIFRRLGGHDKSWRVYFHDLPQAATLADLALEAPLHFRLFEEAFARDAAAGDLPNYSFIEPRYFTSSALGLIPNDEHPPHNVVYGEQLIARVYNAVRAAPTWKKTLLIITYDEHGGCFDHMPPPRAVPPSPGPTHDGFPFDRYGVRVPAVIVSPYMPAGSIVRSAPAGLPHQGPPYPFDHTSIIATLRRLFGLGDPLTGRDAVAPDLIGTLSLDAPENDGPASIPVPEHEPSAAAVAKAAAAAPNDMQHSLCHMAAQLPAATATAAAQVAAAASPPPATGFAKVEDGAAYAIGRMKAFLATL